MISIFYIYSTGVEFHSSSHKATFCLVLNTLTKLQENIISSNRDFPTVVFKKKTVILGFYIKENISSR